MLAAVNQRTERLEKELEAFCKGAGIPQLQRLRLDTLSGGRQDVYRCIQYLRETAGELEAVEREISGKF